MEEGDIGEDEEIEVLRINLTTLTSKLCCGSILYELML